MALTTTATGLKVQQWDEKFFMDHIHANKFARFMGTDEMALVQMRDDLTGKSGDSITLALVNELTGAGVTGSSDLEGSEEALTSRSMKVTLDQLRNGVVFSDIDRQYSAISLRDAARGALLQWATADLRDEIIAALGSINGTAYGSASEGAKDAWLVDNTDRVLFGAAVGNHSTDHSAALANVDTTDDKLDKGIVQLARRIAKTASPRIKPLNMEGNEMFVLFTASLAFRDVKADLDSTHQNAGVRGRENPIFRDGDLLVDDVLIVEVEDIAVLSGVGNSSSDVAPCYLCGAGAIVVAYARRPETLEDKYDYMDKHGLALRQIRAVEKIKFGSGSGDTDDLKDHGVVTLYVSATADA